jgi:tetratricopeptide (TPR) repeat protein
MQPTIDEVLQKAFTAHTSGQLQDAENIYKAILKTHPKNPHANHNLGLLEAEAGRVENALVFFKTALEANKDIEQFWLSCIDSLIQLNLTAEAYSLLIESKKKHGESEALNHLKQRINSLHEMTKGVTLAESGQKLTRVNVLTKLKPDPAIRLAKKKYKAGAIDEAKLIYTDIIKKFPHNKRAIDGLKSISNGALGEVLKVQYPSQPQLDWLMKIFNQGQFQQALDDTTLLISQFPNSLPLYIIQGAAYARLDHLSSAVDSYKKAIKIQPNCAEAYNNMAISLNAQGDIEQALKCYKQAVKFAPKYAEAYYNMGIALTDKGDLNPAIDSYKRAIEINPNYADAYNNMGLLLIDKNDVAAAINSYQQALWINPENIGALNNLGNAQQVNGELEFAIDSYRKALKIKPDFAEVLCNMGNAFNEKGDLELAMSNYKNALNLEPDYGEAHCNLGQLLLRTKDYDEAAEHFRLSTYGQSKLYLLRCLYQQDKKSLFYDQLDFLISQGEIHPIIGSLGCRSAVRYGVEKRNLFCKQPLEYVSKINLKQKYNFEKLFIKPAKAILNEAKLPNKKQSLLTNGYQTSGNLFTLEPDLTKDIEKIIRLEINNYQANFKHSEEGFLTNWPMEYSLKGWLVSMKSGGKLQPHMHENGWISGSIYINVPSKLMTDSGNLVVSIEERSEKETKQQQKSIDVVTGNLCLFPASLLHYTVPFVSEYERIVLAFDVVPKN